MSLHLSDTEAKYKSLDAWILPWGSWGAEACRVGSKSPRSKMVSGKLLWRNNKIQTAIRSYSY